MAQFARKTARLRFGRLSAAGARYFVTFCTKDRICSLAEPKAAEAVLEILRKMDAADDIGLIAAIVMADHVHTLFALGRRLRVGQAIAKLKALARRQTNASWNWQEESFERQLRASDSLEDYAFYIFMNPYRAGLCSLTRHWPWWVCPQPELLAFLEHLKGGELEPEEWIGRSREIGNRIVIRG